MPGKVNVYSLGTEGVNRVKSPVHVPDGALLIAQNAEVSQDRGQRGLRKRSGMARLTPDAAAGTVLAMTSIPLPDPGDDVLSGPGLTGILEIFVTGANTTRTTSDGTTFSNKNAAATAEGFHNGGPPKSYFYNGKLYYCAATLGQVRAYNGTTDTLEAQLPSTHPTTGSALTSVIGFCGVGNKLFVLAMYDSPYVQVMQTTIDTGTVTTFCEGFKTTAGALAGFILRTANVGICAFDGYVWIGNFDSATSTGYLYRAAQGDSAWTVDETWAAGRRPVVVGQAGTSLFVSTVSGGTNFQLERRDVDGTVTTVMGPQAAQICCVGCHEQRVYVIEGGNLHRSTNNGGSFTQIATGTIGSGSGTPGKVTKIGSTYYLFLSSEFIRDDGGSVTEIAVGGGSFLSAFVRF